MNRTEIYECIDEGANFYFRVLGNADHMEYLDKGFYSIIRPKAGQEGGTSLFNIRLEHLSDIDMNEKVNEIKKLGLNTWWGIGLSERMLNAIYGEDRPISATETNNEEGYMALLPGNNPGYKEADIPFTVKKVDNADDFKVWANLSNQLLHGGYPIIHPEKHYHLSEEEIMPCYIAYYNGAAVAVCSIINNKDIASLEFVCTLEEYRRKGLAKAVCITAINEAFKNGSRIITLRAFPNVKKIYKGMGFKLY